ncbi:hypothetical protein D6777_01640 [Candidatus Woesearchaeota archaeon]|nr:MAG: hypothetical protein D6777_01640 [Candidatus Woesearchaeota archaeon]
MVQYIFIFGRDPDLSYLELKTFLKSKEYNFEIKDVNEFGAVVNFESNINAKNIVKSLGGIVKIAEVLNLDQVELYEGKKNRIYYGVSSYFADDEDVKEYLKKRLKKEKFKAMLKSSKKNEPFLTPSESLNIVNQGFEVVLFGDKVGIVRAVYNPNEYKERDNLRPRQRPLHTISIRLAKILINLAGLKKGETLLDPFCGIGVLLQEAMLLNLNVVGIDKDQKCVNDALINLKWLAKKYKLNTKYKVVKGDSTNITKYVKKVDGVATEPYIGPFLKKLPTEQKAKEILNQLKPMYEQLLKGLAKVVKGKIVIIVPRFRLYNNKRVKMNFMRIVKQNGFKASKPIVYVAVKSKIEREIWVLEREER